ncbi:MAG TPA: matrixin family metalloprotease [Candidatus Polarisedimenticolaceae bacterium]|nr:matrixin family metalloprotease [Candidatus Polarisedimenticolaceae bacterium]
MKRSVVALLLLTACPAFAYTRPRFQVGPNVKQSRWPTSIATAVWINADPPNSIVAGSQPVAAVRNAFEIRAAYSALKFNFLSSFLENVSHDGTSLVTFRDTFENRSAAAGFGAVTFFWFTISNGEPVVTEADIVFNPALPHTTTGAGGFDIENLAGHEVTHFLSLEHSPVIGASGWPNFSMADLSRRSLELDDRAGTEFLYPFTDTAARTGSLSGTVLKGGTTPVFGAHVVALRQSDGVTVSDISVTGGQWRIDALPPDTYTVYAEPCDGPCYIGLIDDGIYGGTPFDADFFTQFAGANAAPTVYTVTAGAETGGIAIAPAAGTSALNPMYVASSPDGTTPVLDSMQVTVTQGSSAFVVISGSGIDTVPDDGVAISGPAVTVGTTGIARGTNGGGTYMIVPVTVAPDAPAGLRTVIARTDGALGALAGGFEVRRATPLPGLLRNDAVSQIAPITPALSTIFPLRTTGTDGIPGIGEGVKRTARGTSDDDDFYVPEIPSGYLDADVGVAADTARPLVFYTLTDPALTIHVEKSASGRIRITY